MDYVDAFSYLYLSDEKKVQAALKLVATTRDVVLLREAILAAPERVAEAARERLLAL